MTRETSIEELLRWFNTPDDVDFPMVASVALPKLSEMSRELLEAAAEGEGRAILESDSRLFSALEMIHDEADHALRTEADDPREIMRINLEAIRAVAKAALAGR